MKAGNEKKFEEAFAPALVATRKEAGCVAYYLNRDPDAPSNYIMYESVQEHRGAGSAPEGEAHADAARDGGPDVRGRPADQGAERAGMTETNGRTMNAEDTIREES